MRRVVILLGILLTMVGAMLFFTACELASGCDACNGTGKCKTCEGSGGLITYTENGSYYSSCHICKGSGTCTACNGSGQ